MTPGIHHGLGTIGAPTPATRLKEPVGHADQPDRPGGFFLFSGVKIPAEAFRDRPQMWLRVPAVPVLGNLRGRLSWQLGGFRQRDVADDIRNYGALPVHTVRKIARIGNVHAESGAVEEREALLQDIRAASGRGHLR